MSASAFPGNKSNAPPISVAIVDDDESIRRAVTRLLEASGMRAVSYPSGEDFLADTKRPSFDCLLLDVQLTGMSGIELSQQLTSSGSKTPVIFVTAFDDDETMQQVRKCGCASCLRRNEPARVLLAAIQKASQQGQDSPL